jgi:uncharacterized protein (TIGR02687 family)
MKDVEIAARLKDLFSSHRIVFWYDEGAEFSDTACNLEIEDIKVLRLDKTGPFALKVIVENDDPGCKYLIYAPFAEPPDKDNWLLDTKLYSHTFRADMASVILDDLGLKTKGLRHYIEDRKKFFSSQERTERLKKWISPEDNAEEIDLKMLGVITKAYQPSVFAILISMLEDCCRDEHYDPCSDLKTWGDIQKLSLEDSFWRFIRESFGYIQENPGLSDLLIRLLVTDFTNNLSGDIPLGLKQFLITDPSKALNATVFISQWRSDMNHCKSFELASRYYAKELKIKDHISTLDVQGLIYSSTFEVIEHRIIISIVQAMLAGDEAMYEAIREHIAGRRDEYWAKLEAKPYGRLYDALTMALNLFELRRKYAGGLSFPDAKAMYTAYTQELFLFDQYYRKYHQAADSIEAEGMDILKPLDSAVEACYGEWFMSQVAIAWGDFMEHGLMQNLHTLPGLSQYQFYSMQVKPYLLKQEKNRLFVIVSDAFRYEAAEELTRTINGQYRFSAELETIKSVLPSYTALGMAALLPHKALSFNEKGEILVDDKSVDTIEKRSLVLAQYEGAAIKAADLMAMNKEQGRTFIKDKRIIYVYHNEIDAVGDYAATEAKTFDAVSKTLMDLNGLCRFIINSLSGNRIMITADHGFVYCEKMPDHLDKSVLENKPSNVLIAKKRYILGQNLGKAPSVWAGNTTGTANTEGSMEFWLPKGMNRFHFAGGARYFHGGAMLQEIIVPLITVTQIKGKDLQASTIRKVGVALASPHKKVVTNIARFEFIQTDAVSERLKPQTLSISLRDEDTLISSEQTVTFDSESSSLDDRKRSVKLTLKSGTYDPKKDYYLVLRDTVTSIEHERIPIKIDLAISNVF